jgi:hypothetical protein
LYNLNAIVLINLEDFIYENDLSAQKEEKKKSAWFQEKDVDGIRQECTETPQAERPQKAECLRTAGPVVFFFPP